MSARLRKASPDAVISAPAVRSAIAAAEAARRFSLEPGAIAEGETRRGRGAVSNPHARFEPVESERFDDGWDLAEEPAPLKTEVTIERPRTIIARNDSPDISFDRSINPYRGCEHGCVYCFARPTHAYQGLSPGLDFETKLFAKPNAAELLEKELAKPGYAAKTMAIGTNTDPYQPIEKKFRITRAVLEVLSRTNHPVGIVTKSAPRHARHRHPGADGRARPRQGRAVGDDASTRAWRGRWSRAPRRRQSASTPSASSPRPASRCRCSSRRSCPASTTTRSRTSSQAAYAAGAREAGYVLLRLPHELKEIMRDWLSENYPDKLKHVFSLVGDTRGGKLYDSAWGKRQTGVGPYAWMIGRRFEQACERLGFNRVRRTLRTDLFTPPWREEVGQLSLF